MAVCGRCWICLTKFSCDEDDEGATVELDPDVVEKGNYDDKPRKVCTSCVEVLEGTIDEGANEPHGDGVPKGERLGLIAATVVRSLFARAGR